MCPVLNGSSCARPQWFKLHLSKEKQRENLLCASSSVYASDGCLRVHVKVGPAGSRTTRAEYANEQRSLVVRDGAARWCKRRCMTVGLGFDPSSSRIARVICHCTLPRKQTRTMVATLICSMSKMMAEQLPISPRPSLTWQPFLICAYLVS